MVGRAKNSAATGEVQVLPEMTAGRRSKGVIMSGSEELDDSFAVIAVERSCCNCRKRNVQ
jgi:hypothetical protein